MTDLGAIGKAFARAALSRVVIRNAITVPAGRFAMYVFVAPLSGGRYAPAGRPARREASYAHSPTHPFLFTDTSGGMRGTVKQGSTPLACAAVVLYYRPNGVLVARTKSDSAGAFVFDQLLKDSGAYYAVALDPEGDPMQNALILDRLTAATP